MWKSTFNGNTYAHYCTQTACHCNHHAGASPSTILPSPSTQPTVTSGIHNTIIHNTITDMRGAIHGGGMTDACPVLVMFACSELSDMLFIKKNKGKVVQLTTKDMLNYTKKQH